jgi:hypothetical protein
MTMGNIYSITGKPISDASIGTDDDHLDIPERLCELALAIEHGTIPCDEMTIVTSHGEVFHFTKTKQDDGLNVKSVVFNCTIGIAKMTSYAVLPEYLLEKPDE